jgi:O-methyltransferase/8-demethyl-8-(2,3-dimethoxy-alpha-L-rhamnosyl)tetracenomycin-C 4'-O-methyltransferase
MNATDLYLDLLAKTLTGTLREDPPIDPWHGEVHAVADDTVLVGPGKFDPAVRAAGQDWPAKAETMIGLARLTNLRGLIERILAADTPGDFLEAGIWRGGACIYMRGVLAAHGVLDRKVIGVDSFAGLPPPAAPQDAGDRHHLFHVLAVSKAEVRRNFARFGFDDARTVLFEGLFADVLPTAPIGPLALLRLDGDMYGSTMDVLNACYDKVVPHGYVVVDDYNLPPVRQAISDFLEARGELDHVPVLIDRNGIYFQKEPHNG